MFNFGAKCRDLKFFLKLTLYQLVYYIALCRPAKRKPRHLLLIKTDELGDYLLMRHLLPLFRQSALYRDYTITLAGNTIYRQIFNNYDQQVVDDVIWMDKSKFKKDLLYRLKFLLRIRRAGASVAINLIYSHSFRLDDMIMAVTGAPSRIGMTYENPDAGRYERLLTPRRLYTGLEDTGEKTLFEAARNARFVAKLLDIPVPPVSTKIEAAEDVHSLALPSAYFVIFPGSGIPEKKWPTASFAVVAHHLAGRYGLFPVVCGSMADAADCAAFIGVYSGPVLDLAGKTTLPQLLGVLKGAACLISVDTGSVHLAAAVGCPVFALYSGRHYGRFAPYPPDVATCFYPVYPDEIDELIEKNVSFVSDTIPVDLLKRIPPQKMIAKIDEQLPNCR